MLSLFPTFFDYSAVAVTVLRIVAAFIFIAEGYKMFPRKEVAASGNKNKFFQKTVSLVESVLGVFLLAGLFTQVAAVALALVSAGRLFLSRKNEAKKEGAVSFYILLFFVSLSFLFLGPGFFGVDYPL